MGRGGQNTPVELMTTPDLLVQNPQFAPFLEPDFNAGQFASQALAGAHITAQDQTNQLQVPSSKLPLQSVFSVHHQFRGVQVSL
jgi:hypothetical protein